MKTIYSCLFLLAGVCIANETQITSDRVEMLTGESQNTFHFTGNVKVKGKDLDAKSDEMFVYSARLSKEKKSDVGSIEKIVARGNVLIAQVDRKAQAGYAEIYPKAGRLFLTENPEVKEKDGIVRGEKITFLRGQKRAIVEGSNLTQRATVLLPEMENVDFGLSDKD